LTESFSVATGRWGLCCSMAATGMSATRRSCTATFTSAQDMRRNKVCRGADPSIVLPAPYYIGMHRIVLPRLRVRGPGNGLRDALDPRLRK